jgi:hypothetical protein
MDARSWGRPGIPSRHAHDCGQRENQAASCTSRLARTCRQDARIETKAGGNPAVLTTCDSAGEGSRPSGSLGEGSWPMGRRRDCAGKFGCFISLSPHSGPRGGCSSSRHFLFPYRRHADLRRFSVRLADPGSTQPARRLLPQRFSGFGLKMEIACCGFGAVDDKVYSQTNPVPEAFFILV